MAETRDNGYVYDKLLKKKKSNLTGFWHLGKVKWIILLEEHRRVSSFFCMP